MPYKRQKTKRREEVTFTQEPTEKILQEVITSLRKHPRKFQAAGVIGEPPPPFVLSLSVPFPPIPAQLTGRTSWPRSYIPTKWAATAGRIGTSTSVLGLTASLTQISRLGRWTNFGPSCAVFTST